MGGTGDARKRLVGRREKNGGRRRGSHGREEKEKRKEGRVLLLVVSLPLFLLFMSFVKSVIDEEGLGSLGKGAVVIQASPEVNDLWEGMEDNLAKSGRWATQANEEEEKLLRPDAPVPAAVSEPDTISTTEIAPTVQEEKEESKVREKREVGDVDTEDSDPPKKKAKGHGCSGSLRVISNAQNELRKAHVCVRALYGFAAKIYIKWPREWKMIWNVPWDPLARDLETTKDLETWTPENFQTPRFIEMFITPSFYACVQSTMESVNIVLGRVNKPLYTLWELLNLQSTPAFQQYVEKTWRTPRGAMDSTSITVGAILCVEQEKKHCLMVLLRLRGAID